METDVGLNLASKECGKAVEAYLPGSVWPVACVFGELENDGVVEKDVLCKIVRGQMVRWLAGNRLENPEDL